MSTSEKMPDSAAPADVAKQREIMLEAARKLEKVLLIFHPRFDHLYIKRIKNAVRLLRRK